MERSSLMQVGGESLWRERDKVDSQGCPRHDGRPPTLG